MITGVIVALCFLMLSCAFLFLGYVKLSFAHSVAGDIPDVTLDGHRDKAAKMNDKEYVFNQDIISILLIGTDKKGEEVDPNDATTGGQADSLYLLVFNTRTKLVSIVSINRNTMADIEVYDEDNVYQGLYSGQIALGHSYGDGKEESCERLVRAVSRLCNGVPIHGYVSIDISLIPKLNDLLGRVSLVVEEGYYDPEFDLSFTQGATVELYGNRVYSYLQYRDTQYFLSNDQRLRRQKQYVREMIKKLKDHKLKTLQAIPKVLWTVNREMTTNLNLFQMIYLAIMATVGDVNVEHIHQLKGITHMGEIYEEYYLNEKKLARSLLLLYYEPAYR